MNRRGFIAVSVKSAMATGMIATIPTALLLEGTAHAAVAAGGLSDPAVQPLFTNLAPNALNPAFKYQPNQNRLNIAVDQGITQTGLLSNNGKKRLSTTFWGYGVDGGPTWPGKTIERHVEDDPLQITWLNHLIKEQNGRPLRHLLPVDESLHWAYSLHGASSANGIDYRQFSIKKHGVPIVAHVHGGRNDASDDGNPEYFFSPGHEVRGPRFVQEVNSYGGPDWNNVAGTMWYHDHALGLTRLNVYAGLAGFFILRDDDDTGAVDNPLGLPAEPYELAYAVQDRMFTNQGKFFYPAFPGDPFYDDFITDEGVELPSEVFPDGGPTALAEFFGDHIVVNGVIWPKASVEPRQYRVRLVNGTDSRFMRLKLKAIPGGASERDATDPHAGYDVPFFIIGSDQSLRSGPAEADHGGVDFLPGERLDLVIDFSEVPFGSRVIVENLLGDSPFGGDLPGPHDVFPDRRTDRIMAFDVEVPLDSSRIDTNVGGDTALRGGHTNDATVTRTRKLALFEGQDEYGRLQPLLGTAEPVVDVDGNVVTGSLTWFQPITENPGVGDTEIWEIYNATGDAHPVHVHLVHFQVLDRQKFSAESVNQPTIQHNGTTGVGFRLENIETHGRVHGPAASEETRRDMVIALPDEVTRIKMTFGKPGRYVWHCHILSHEDHEMMRPFHVGPGPF